MVKENVYAVCIKVLVELREKWGGGKENHMKDFASFCLFLHCIVYSLR